MKRATQAKIGRALTCLTFGPASAQHGVLTVVSVRVRKRRSKTRLVVRGPARLRPRVTKHIRDVLLPIVDNTASELGIDTRRITLDLSLSNCGAASAREREATIDGYSLDAAVYIAALSAVLKLPVPEDMAFSAHVASADGDLRSVSGLPAKLEALKTAADIRVLFHAPWDADASLRSLLPAEHDRTIASALSAARRLVMFPVTHVAELTKAVFDDEAVVLASLAHGYFHVTNETPHAHALSPTAQIIASGSLDRLKAVLSRYLNAGHVKPAKTLLVAFARYYVNKREYPRHFGQWLHCLVGGATPSLLRVRSAFPLLPNDLALALQKHATAEDYSDVKQLRATLDGDIIATHSMPPQATFGASTDASATLSRICAELSERNLAGIIDAPLDCARAAFAIPSVWVEDVDEFNRILCSLYAALQRALGMYADECNPYLESAALETLARAYAREGGVDGARADARGGARGNMRVVLNRLADQYKRERQEEYAWCVLRVAVESRSFAERCELARQLLDLMPPQGLGDGIKLKPAQLIENLPELTLHYVRAKDALARRLGTL